MTSRTGAWAGIAIALLLAAPIGRAAADDPLERKLCVYDPSGAVGDAFNLMKDYRGAALEWGVRFELEPYTDEKTAAEDLKAGKCDGALLTGVRSRRFNKFAGTVEAMGAVPDYEMLETVLGLLASPKIASRMKSGGFEAVGIFPAGGVHLYVRNREWNSVPKLAGKRIATMDFDDAAITMVNRAGATVVPADIGTFAGMFNNGSVDACYAPLTAFEPLELKKGLGDNGAIIGPLPTAQLTLQLLVRTELDWPEGFGNASRSWASRNFDRVLRAVRRAEKAIPDKYWVEVPEAKIPEYEKLFRKLRIELKGDEYDGTMLALLRRVRCRRDPTRAECAQKKE